MALSHIGTLYFDGRTEAAKKRVQKLKAVGLIAERQRKASERSILFLTRSAITLLSSRGDLLRYPHFSIDHLDRRANVSDLTIRHELQVMDVKTSLVRAAAVIPTVAIGEFTT